ncbi:MAG: DUF1343 domain-containing protein [Bacteroidetes bacterium]|nr:DUF1343 domain-containing protein [Bacteroidota bacterium]
MTTNAKCLLALSFLIMAEISAQNPVPAADRIEAYIGTLKGKRIGVFANHTSILSNGRHLVDTLRALGLHVSVIFGPEHGFRGTADAGDKVGNYLDEATRIPVVSLYGSKRRPDADDLKDVDVMVFDIQDVGVRYYTYISSLEEYMESAFLHSRKLVLLDRPNPNGHYVDGPVLDRRFRSFVGMQPVPVVYGMTIGEYARMLVGEKWLAPDAQAAYERLSRSEGSPLMVIPCGNYQHASTYLLPVKPSPNLPDMASVYWYPSTCYFEGTVLSEGRGTSTPFQVFGHPALPNNLFAFTPISMPGAKEPKLKGQTCYGWDLRGTPEAVKRRTGEQICLEYLLEAYRLFPEKDKFFIIPKSGDTAAAFFNKLAGNAELMSHLKAGHTERQIRKSWEPGLKSFRALRKKYLIYP